MARRERPLNGQLTEGEVLVLVAVLVPVAPGCGDDVVYTCRHQRPFCSESCVSNGLRTNGNRRDYVLDLDTLWRLAWGRYEGRMDAATPAASRRQRGSTNGLPDLPASSGALIRTDAADSLSR
jgi:hypothetical protein